MIDITLDRDTDKPLYAQIRDALQEAIEKKNLKDGEQLPTVNALAAQMSVTQCTIRRAYEDLTKGGMVVCQVGRGTFVKNTGPSALQACQTGDALGAPSPAAPLDPEFKIAARRLRMGIAKSLDNLLALHKRPSIIQFTVGVPGKDLVRQGLLKELVLDALERGQDAYQWCQDPMGLLELRKAIADRLNQTGEDISPDQILITNGSQQAVHLIAQAALDSGQRILCETPCYTGIPNAFSALGHWVEAVPRDLHGPLSNRLNRFADGKSSLFYLCPLIHNPIGTDLDPKRRRFLTDWARDQRAVLIADEIMRDIRYDSPSPLSLLVDNGAERTILVGSLSKSFVPGLRVGWLISDPERVRTLATYKRAADIGCPPLMQGIALSLLRTGEYDTHVDHVREQFQMRRDAILRALERYMPDGVTWTTPVGGFNMWIELPQGYSSIVLYLLAVERGVSFIPGPYMDIDHRFLNALRLSYGDIPVEQIQEGIELLASAVEDLLKEPPNDLGLSGLGDFL